MVPIFFQFGNDINNDGTFHKIDQYYSMTQQGKMPSPKRQHKKIFTDEKLFFCCQGS